MRTGTVTLNCTACCCGASERSSTLICAISSKKQILGSMGHRGCAQLYAQLFINLSNFTKCGLAVYCFDIVQQIQRRSVTRLQQSFHKVRNEILLYILFTICYCFHGFYCNLSHYWSMFAHLSALYEVVRVLCIIIWRVFKIYRLSGFACFDL